MAKKINPAFSMLANSIVPASAAVPAPVVQPTAPEPVQAAPEPRPQPVVKPAAHVAPPPQRPLRSRESAFRPPSRIGKRALTVWLDPAAKRQFDQICLNEDKNGEELLREFLNDAFDRRGFSRLA